MYHWEVAPGDIIAIDRWHEHTRYARVTGVRRGEVCGTAINGTVSAWPRHRLGAAVAVSCGEARRVLPEEIVANRIEVNRRQRGHRFYPLASEVKRAAGLFEAAHAHARDSGSLDIAAHYIGEREYWVAGYGTKGALAGVWAYSRPRHETEGGAWEYFDLVELESRQEQCCGVDSVIHRDTGWQRGPAREVIPGYQEG